MSFRVTIPIKILYLNCFSIDLLNIVWIAAVSIAGAVPSMCRSTIMAIHDGCIFAGVSVFQIDCSGKANSNGSSAEHR